MHHIVIDNNVNMLSRAKTLYVVRFLVSHWYQISC